MSGSEGMNVQKVETFTKVGIPTGCTGCERAQSTAKASRLLLTQLAAYDNRSAYYGQTPGRVQVNITQDRLEQLRAQNPDFVVLETEYRANMQKHSDDSSACHYGGGATQVYELGESFVQCALERNEG